GRKNIAFVKNAAKKFKNMIRLAEKYKKEVIPAMMKKFGYKNVMAVPKIEKTMVNTGFGRLIMGKTSEEQKKIYTAILDDLILICAQRPVLTKAKKSISGFKTRQGMPIGAMVTLRGRKMHDFLDRVIHVAFPRSRDFRGIDPKSFDKKGNLTVAIKEHIVFPEVSPEKAKTILSVSDFKLTRSSDRVPRRMTGQKPKEKVSRTGKIAVAFEVGKLIAQKALEKKIKKIVFDRGGYKYHGRVRALAEGAREGGLQF
ncbi:unnamed protein product, partial [marine sediment metagenome]